MRIKISEFWGSFSWILWSIQGGLTIPLILLDIKEQRVPLLLVLLFSLLLILASGLNQESSEFLIKGGSVTGLSLLALRWFSQRLGGGDVLLLGSILLYLPLSMIPSFLIMCGILGVAFGLCWRKLYGEIKFPFVPAILLSFWMQLYLEGRV